MQPSGRYDLPYQEPPPPPPKPLSLELDENPESELDVSPHDGDAADDIDEDMEWLMVLKVEVKS
ncbi:hypothetical protein KB1_18590 [Cutibacterium modestum]|uniref:Uncharacterized protein n=1 Tax=Cutibacterium modestum TaxID=2559073 RepID=A0AAD1NWK7_9ACTN|nr:hypothetical protein KB1_18590 [Cutibacterium modestum]